MGSDNMKPPHPDRALFFSQGYSSKTPSMISDEAREFINFYSVCLSSKGNGELFSYRFRGTLCRIENFLGKSTEMVNLQKQYRKQEQQRVDLLLFYIQIDPVPQSISMSTFRERDFSVRTSLNSSMKL